MFFFFRSEMNTFVEHTSRSLLHSMTLYRFRTQREEPPGAANQWCSIRFIAKLLQKKSINYIFMYIILGIPDSKTMKILALMHSLCLS